MSNYKKVDVDTIKAKLKAGEYAGSTGAMRAIGKTQGLSEKDKEKLRAAVRKHFGEESAPTKTAKSPRAKKATKKTAKKGAKKASSAPAEAPVAAKPAKAGRKKVAKKVAKRGGRGGREKASSEVDTETEKATTTEVTNEASTAPVGKHPVVLQMGQIISTVGDSLKAMEVAKRLFPKGHFDQDVETMTRAMTRAVRVIDEEVTAPRLGDMHAGSTAARKKASKKGTRPKVVSATAAEPAEAEEADEVESPADDGPSELTAEEQAQLEAARDTQAAAGG